MVLNAARVLELLKDHEQPLSVDEIVKALENEAGPSGRERQKAVVDITNALLQQRHVEAQFGAGGVLKIKYLSPTDAKAKVVGNKEALLLRLIGESGNMGIWRKHLLDKVKGDISQAEFKKILEALEKSNKIKTVSSVREPRKKLYMLFGTEPNTAITGGTWYSDADFDAEFVNIVYKTCHDYLAARYHNAPVYATQFEKVKDCFVSARELQEHFAQRRIVNVELSESDIDNMMKTLVFDGIAQVITAGSPLAPTHDQRGRAVPPGTALYKYVQPKRLVNGFTSTPCGVCPVFNDCHEGNAISPETCIYFKEWLEF